MLDVLRLEHQLQFLVELDRLKEVYRKSYVLGTNRLENAAEHSWHVSLAALLLSEYARESVEVEHVLHLLLVHDIVEIDAGDTPVYDLEGRRSQSARESVAAERLFGLLPADQSACYRAWWEEFEAQQTPAAQFAKAVDRLIPLLENYHAQGKGWRAMHITREQVLAVNQPPMMAGAPQLWTYVQGLIEDAGVRGFLPSREELTRTEEVETSPERPLDGHT